MYLISLNFRGIFPVVLDCSFLDSALLFRFYQNYMAFWPQTSTFSFERDFSNFDGTMVHFSIKLCNNPDFYCENNIDNPQGPWEAY